MRWMDEKGRLLGWVNILDLALLGLIACGAAIIYTWMSAPHRIAPQFISPATTVWVSTTLVIPEERRWVLDYVKPGLKQFDERSGECVAEVIEAVAAQGEISMRLRVAPDPGGRFIFGDKPVLPGQYLRIETSACIIEGCVRYNAEKMP